MRGWVWRACDESNPTREPPRRAALAQFAACALASKSRFASRPLITSHPAGAASPFVRDGVVMLQPDRLCCALLPLATLPGAGRVCRSLPPERRVTGRERATRTLSWLAAAYPARPAWRRGLRVSPNTRSASDAHRFVAAKEAEDFDLSHSCEKGPMLSKSRGQGPEPADGK